MIQPEFELSETNPRTVTNNTQLQKHTRYLGAVNEVFLTYFWHCVDGDGFNFLSKSDHMKSFPFLRAA